MHLLASLQQGVEKISAVKRLDMGLFLMGQNVKKMGIESFEWMTFLAFYKVGGKQQLLSLVFGGKVAFGV